MADGDNSGKRVYQPPEPMEFKRSQIAAMAPGEYARNRDEIIRSQKAGKIIDDISTLRNNIDAQMVKKQGGDNAVD